jgi:tRNA dimethylallyltransferase
MRTFLDCCFLTGPTASGKTVVGVELARRLGAEIVSMDSMALYRGMDIGTAKPTAEERRAVPHHLVDILEPHEEYSLAQYLEAARRAVEDIRSRGCEVLFVGGTPLYLKGLLRGIFQGPPADWEFRRRLQEEAAQHGPEWLHQRLAAMDPAAAARLHPNDTKRLIRALEVFEKTDRPISEWQRQFEVGRPAEECRVFVLDWPKEELHARIGLRVDAMFAAGLMEEVRRLLGSAGVPPAEIVVGTRRPCEHDARCGMQLSKTAGQAVGYREVIAYLQGVRPLAETIELVKLHTRQLAKRQGTWFRSLSECRFVPVSRESAPAAVAERIANS